MSRGRPLKDRKVNVDVSQLVCSCMGPLKSSPEALEDLEQVVLYADELQALVYKDLENLTMQQSADKMGVSKTVFAGMYTSARKKQTDCLVNGKILMCEERMKKKKVPQ